MSGIEASRKVVLLVDDDLRTLRCLAEMLREDGLSVEIARDGAAAIARLSRAPVAALVTELTTAHADGLAVARFARSQCAGILVVLVTGYPHLFDPEALRGGPPVQLFTKPVVYSELKEALLAGLRGSLTACKLPLVI